MGKYLKKPNMTTDVVDFSQSTLGVRTRAKTLALQQLHESSYLQLRSRKLEKPMQQNTNLEQPIQFCSQETSFGDNNNNNIEFDGRERGTRESTPCSFIRDSDDNVTPGSSTRAANRYASNRVIQTSMLTFMPSVREIDEFFAHHAQEQQRLFSEKYNFDIVNEKPLEGHYEWVRVQP